MAALPTPIAARRSNPRRGEAAWTIAPGAAPTPPRAPAKLGTDGRAWWRAAWESPVSGMWSSADVQQVRRGARLAAVCATAPKAALLVELRRLEDSLGLTRIGRLKLRILLPDTASTHDGGLPEPPTPIDNARHRARRGRIDQEHAQSTAQEPAAS